MITSSIVSVIARSGSYPAALKGMIHSCSLVAMSKGRRNGPLRSMQPGPAALAARTAVPQSTGLTAERDFPGRSRLGKPRSKEGWNLPLIVFRPGSSATLAAPNSRHTSNSRVPEGVAKRVSADHSGGADDYKALLARRWNVHRSHLVRCRHNRGRSSIQSTYNRRSAKSHVPSIFTKVSR